MKNGYRKRYLLKLIELYGSKCIYCGKKLKPSEICIDHVIAKVKSGTNDISNLRPSCSNCNASKWGFSIFEWTDKLYSKKLRAKAEYTKCSKILKSIYANKLDEMEEI